jgi:hypothetical protein
VALVVWQAAEAALEPAPELDQSTGGGLTACGYRPGLTSCDPPELAGSTIALVVALTVVGALLIIGTVVSVVRRGARRR